MESRLSGGGVGWGVLTVFDWQPLIGNMQSHSETLIAGRSRLCRPGWEVLGHGASPTHSFLIRKTAQIASVEGELVDGSNHNLTNINIYLFT